MKLLASLAVIAAAAQTVSAHCAHFTCYFHMHILIFLLDIWTTLVAGGTTSTAAIRQPVNNSPVEAVSSGAMTCGAGPRAASETVTVSAGSSVSFRLDNTLYHPGPAAIYLGQVPGGQTAASWNGAGANWFKVRSSCDITSDSVEI